MERTELSSDMPLRPSQACAFVSASLFALHAASAVAFLVWLFRTPNYGPVGGIRLDMVGQFAALSIGLFLAGSIVGLFARRWYAKLALVMLNLLPFAWIVVYVWEDTRGY